MATVPFLFEMGERTNWFTSDFVTSMLAISESTPGPLGINMSTYVGYNIAGLFGAICSCSGLVTPSIIIILVIAKLLLTYNEKPLVKTSFYYLRSCSTGLIIYALIKILLTTLFISSKSNTTGLIIYLLLCIIIALNRKVHPIIWIILGSLISLIFT